MSSLIPIIDRSNLGMIGCQSWGDCTHPSSTIKDVVSLGWSGEAIEMENLFIILRLVRQCKLGQKGRSRRPGPARARLWRPRAGSGPGSGSLAGRRLSHRDSHARSARWPAWECAAGPGLPGPSRRSGQTAGYSLSVQADSGSVRLLVLLIIPNYS